MELKLHNLQEWLDNDKRLLFWSNMRRYLWDFTAASVHVVIGYAALLFFFILWNLEKPEAEVLAFVEAMPGQLHQPVIPFAFLILTLLVLKYVVIGVLRNIEDMFKEFICVGAAFILLYATRLRQDETGIWLLLAAGLTAALSIVVVLLKTKSIDNCQKENCEAVKNAVNQHKIATYGDYLDIVKGNSENIGDYRGKLEAFLKEVISEALEKNEVDGYFKKFAGSTKYVDRFKLIHEDQKGRLDEYLASLDKSEFNERELREAENWARRMSQFYVKEDSKYYDGREKSESIESLLNRVIDYPAEKGAEVSD